MPWDIVYVYLRWRIIVCLIWWTICIWRDNIILRRLLHWMLLLWVRWKRLDLWDLWCLENGTRSTYFLASISICQPALGSHGTAFDSLWLLEWDFTPKNRIVLHNPICELLSRLHIMGSLLKQLLWGKNWICTLSIVRITILWELLGRAHLDNLLWLRSIIRALRIS